MDHDNEGKVSPRQPDLRCRCPTLRVAFGSIALLTWDSIGTPPSPYWPARCCFNLQLWILIPAVPQRRNWEPSCEYREWSHRVELEMGPCVCVCVGGGGSGDVGTVQACLSHPDSTAVPRRIVATSVAILPTGPSAHSLGL